MLERLRERIEAFVEAAARDRCLHALEDRPEVRLGARWARARDLFGPDRIREVQRTLSGAAGTEERQIRHLLHFLALGHSHCLSAGLLDRLGEWEARATLTAEGDSVPFRAARAWLRRTADRRLRQALEEARLVALDEQQQEIEGLVAHHRDAVEELGYGSFVESWEVLSGIDLRGLAREAERFLAETDAALRELLAWHLPRLAGVEPDEAEEADAARLEWAAPFLPHFADARLLSRAQAALAETGLDPRAEGRLDTVLRAHLPTGEGAVCCPLRVPDEVLLTVSSEPGVAAQAEALRALGYALHRAHTSADLPLELRRLGDESVPLGFGHLLGGLTSNAPFVEKVCGVPRGSLSGYRRLVALLDLLRVRGEVGLLLFEMEAHAEPDPRRLAELYVESMTRATGLRHDVRGAYWPLRWPFRAARALRAEQLGAVLAVHLRDRFDEDWWRNPRSGALLRDLFQVGQSYTAAELSVQLVSQPLSLDRVRESLEERW